MAKKVVIGRIVHYVIAEGEHRPAIIVRVWDNEFPANPDHSEGVNLQIFLDGSNDAAFWPTDILGNPVAPHGSVRADNATLWVTSSMYSNLHRVGTWHWPEHEGDSRE